MKEFIVIDEPGRYENSTEICYYPGKRYLSWHKNRLKRDKQYWHDLGIKFATVVIFEVMENIYFF